MNLVISGPIEVNLRNALVALVKPRNVVRLHARADRLESADDSAEVREAVARLCDASRVDHAYVEPGKKLSDFKLLAMDMDSTLITIECIDEIADFAGKKKEVAAITEAAMRGEITDFAESLRRRVALLAGTSVDVLERVYEERLRLTEGAEDLLSSARSNGLKSLLVSGGFTYFTDRLKDRLGLDYTYANRLDVVSNQLTGIVCAPVFGANEKAAALSAAASLASASRQETIVIGDGANDIQMMELTDTSVAFHAKQVVRFIATYRIDFGDLGTVIDWFS